MSYSHAEDEIGMYPGAIGEYIRGKRKTLFGWEILKNEGA
jgi:hypothetical protein